MKTSSVDIARSMGFEEISSTKTSFTMCDGEKHLVGRKGDGVGAHILSTAFGQMTKCDCNV